MTAAQYGQTLAAGVLVALFVVSGTQKVRTPFPAALAMMRFGLVRRIDARYGRLAGVAELAVAVTLVAKPTTWWPFAAATALGALFVTVVSRALLRGDAFPCGCFGAKNDRLSRGTLVRAGLVFVLASGGVVMGIATPSSVSTATALIGVASGVLVACTAAAWLTLHEIRPFSSQTPTSAEA